MPRNIFRPGGQFGFFVGSHLGVPLTFFPAGCDQMWYVVNNQVINGFLDGRGVRPASGHGQDGRVTVGGVGLLRGSPLPSVGEIFQPLELVVFPDPAFHAKFRQESCHLPHG
jgi:hypothetical protein